MPASGVLTCLKHFPGHGSSRGDSHHGFTDISDSADLERELAPYRALVKAGLVDSVMPVHVCNRNIDPWYPASLSRYTVNRLLRSRVGFKGLVVSDDLLMSAVTQRYGVEEASILALGAGVDVLLISQNTVKREARAPERVVAAIRQALAKGRLSPKAVTAALQRLEAFRGRVKW